MFREGQRVVLQTEREGNIRGRVSDTSFLEHGELFLTGDDGRERMIPLDQIESHRRLDPALEYDGPHLGDLERDL